jgi:uncharacterized protein
MFLISNIQKGFVIASLLGLVGTLVPLEVQAQTIIAKEEQLITTQGQGEVKILPDSLQVTVGVESEATTLVQARTQNNQKTQKTVQAIKALNIPNLVLKTQYLQVNPVQSYQEKNRLPRIIGYRATNSLLVTVTKAGPDKLGEYGSQIVDTALNAGANNAGGIQFYLEDMQSARRQALQEAVRDARQNAQAMAEAAGVTLSGVYSLEGTPQYGGGPIRMYAARESMDSVAQPVPATPVEIGETTITSTVTARFKF